MVGRGCPELEFRWTEKWSPETQMRVQQVQKPRKQCEQCVGSKEVWAEKCKALETNGVRK